MEQKVHPERIETEEQEAVVVEKIQQTVELDTTNLQVKVICIKFSHLNYFIM